MRHRRQIGYQSTKPKKKLSREDRYSINRVINKIEKLSLIKGKGKEQKVAASLARIKEKEKGLIGYQRINPKSNEGRWYDFQIILHRQGRYSQSQQRLVSATDLTINLEIKSSYGYAIKHLLEFNAYHHPQKKDYYFYLMIIEDAVSAEQIEAGLRSLLIKIGGFKYINKYLPPLVIFVNSNGIDWLEPDFKAKTFKKKTF